MRPLLKSNFKDILIVANLQNIKTTGQSGLLPFNLNKNLTLKVYKKNCLVNRQKFVPI